MGGSCVSVCTLLCFSLIPHMPRENFRYLVPMVKELCKKYDIEYKETKTLFEAFWMVFE